MQNAVTVGPPRRLASWMVYLAVTSVLVMIYISAPRAGSVSDVVQFLCYSGLIPSSAVWLAVGVRRRRPSQTSAW